MYTHLGRRAGHDISSDFDTTMAAHRTRAPCPPRTTTSETLLLRRLLVLGLLLRLLRFLLHIVWHYWKRTIPLLAIYRQPRLSSTKRSTWPSQGLKTLTLSSIVLICFSSASISADFSTQWICKVKKNNIDFTLDRDCLFPDLVSHFLSGTQQISMYWPASSHTRPASRA